MERGILVGVALLSSAAIVFAVSFMLEGLVATVLQAVAAGDAVLAMMFLMRGLRARSESGERMPPDPPHVLVEKVRNSHPDLLNSLGSSADEVIGLLRHRRKIEAIKLIRETTSRGLADAKDIADRIEASMRR